MAQQVGRDPFRAIGFTDRIAGAHQGKNHFLGCRFLCCACGRTRDTQKGSKEEYSNHTNGLQEGWCNAGIYAGHTCCHFQTNTLPGYQGQAQDSDRSVRLAIGSRADKLLLSIEAETPHEASCDDVLPSPSRSAPHCHRQPRRARSPRGDQEPRAPTRGPRNIPEACFPRRRDIEPALRAP